MLSPPDHAGFPSRAQRPSLLARLSAPDYESPARAVAQGTLVMHEPESPDGLSPIARQAVARTRRCRDGIDLAGEVVTLAGVRP